MHRVAALKADTILSFSALRSNKPMCPPVLALKWLQIGVSVKGVGGRRFQEPIPLKDYRLCLYDGSGNI